MSGLRAFRVPVSLLAACLAAACSTAGSASKEEAESPEHKQREVLEARAALAVAESKSAHSIADAEADLLQAQRELAEAKAVAAGLAPKTALALTEATIERDEASYQAEEAKAELGELEAMYQADEFAKLTKELVLQRGRRRLEVSQRRLQARTDKLALLRDVEQEHERRQQADKVAAAEAAVAKAERGLSRARGEGDLEVLKARHALAKAEAKP